ncbi:LuxR C-terminal-related transcriptional regulator [Streptomyces aurantiacus]|nr:LuxR C-terminal-related transcriptional regulator [Streptomyces aurantiacus]
MTEHGSHEAVLLCEAGRDAYLRALQEGGLRLADAERVTCLFDLGLLYPDAEDSTLLRPTAPSVALPQLLHRVKEHIAHASGVTILRGLDRIQLAMGRAGAGASEELLVIQPGIRPGGTRPTAQLAVALPLAQGVLDRGGRMRTLCRRTARHSQPAPAHCEPLDGDVEVRTLDELPGRLILFDRATAFVPAGKSRDDVALELRQPAVIDYLVAIFEILWRLATPLFPPAEPLPTGNGITARQRSIAALLTEGLTDTEIAARLSMNVRTARVHIAKLSAVLDSHSRAQLGYLIGKSGILDEPR